MTSTLCLGLGSNLGDKQENLAEALRRVGALARVCKVSSLYRTEPVGFLDQDWFLNAAAVLETELEPMAMLSALLEVERQMGRVRTVRNGPRRIDLDILLWGSRVLATPTLEIPHPRLAERHFVLQPLAEIAGEWVHPRAGRTIAALARQLGDPVGVERFAADGWPATEAQGPDAAGGNRAG